MRHRSEHAPQGPEGASEGLQPAGEKRGRARQIGRTKGGMNTKLHAVAEAKGRPIWFFMSAGRVSDYAGAVGQPAEGGLVAGSQGLRGGLAAKSVERQGDEGLHPRPEIAQDRCEIRQ